MFKHGAEGLSFDPIIAFGVNGAEPHHVPNKTKLKNNQLVTIDIGCKYKGYCSDITRTFFVGTKPTKQQKEIFNLIYKAQKLGLAKAKVGIKACDLDEVVRKFILNSSKR
ncbi:MAG: M24 family metallopeptidase [Clostridia bacterium]|nr:M24 family metallopeptidase [Clostridia bacterium]